MEDFFSAQGYSRDEKLTWRQKFKNDYIEFKYGMKYYNFFDWQEWKGILLRSFVISIFDIVALKKIALKKPVFSTARATFSSNKN